MNKGCKYYAISFLIFINNNYELFYGGLYAKDDDEALNKLPNAIQKRIGGITEKIYNISIYNKNKKINIFYDWEKMLQKINKA